MPTLAKLEETTQVTTMEIARMLFHGDIGEDSEFAQSFDQLDETTQITVMNLARLALGGELGETIQKKIADQLDMTYTEGKEVWLELAYVLQMQD